MIVHTDYCSFIGPGEDLQEISIIQSRFAGKQSYRQQFWWTLAIAVHRLRVPVGVFMLDALKQDNIKCALLLPGKT